MLVISGLVKNKLAYLYYRVIQNVSLKYSAVVIKKISQKQIHNQKGPDLNYICVSY